MKDMIIEKVKNALSTTLNLKSTQSIDLKTNLKNELGLDSMSSLTFLMALEESVEGFVVDPDTLDAEHLSTVETVIDYVHNELTAKLAPALA